MDFEQKKRPKSNDVNYHLENLKLSRTFSKKLLEEMKELVRSIVIFGSNNNNTLNKDSDIDLMVVLDNISVFVTDELREAYRIIVNKLNQDIGKGKFHVMTINLSDLWDMSRKGDPILINVLRYGSPIFDRDLIEPLQYLLEIGKIRPSRESAYNYIARSETLLKETNNHIHEAVLDLYYSVIDIVHASLMVKGEMPPSPKEMPQLYAKVFKSDKTMVAFSKDIEEIYKVAKDIEHRRVIVNGANYDKYKKKSEKLVSTLKSFCQKEMKKKDMFEF